MKKRILSTLMALCLCLTLLPTAALAATPTGTPLTQTSVTSEGTLTLTGGSSYYLNGDITISQTIEITGTVTLDLNGHVLKYENSTTSGSVIKVESGGNLTLTDSDTTGTPHYFTVDDTGLWNYYGESAPTSEDHKTVTGGTGIINQHRSSRGGGACMEGTFYMTGGSIVGCTASSEGGGVNIDNAQPYPTFTMSGGTIKNCKADGVVACASGAADLSFVRYK